MYSDHALGALKLMIQRYGPEIGQDARRVEALLKDLCPEAKKEINALAFAARDNVPDELKNRQGLPIGVVIARASARLKEHSGFRPSLCTWAVEAWARALDLISTEDMTEQVDCPGCASSIRVPVRARRKLIRCPKCNVRFQWESDGNIEGPQEFHLDPNHEGLPVEMHFLRVGQTQYHAGEQSFARFGGP